MRKVCTIALLAAAVSGCGGGGSSAPLPAAPAPTPAPAPPPPPAPAAVTVTVKLDQAELRERIANGDEYDFEVTGDWSGNPPAAPVLDVQDSSGAFKPAVITSNGNRFTLQLQTRFSVFPGQHTGTLTVRACKDTACSATYDGAAASLPVALTVDTVADWAMHQRNERHDGYVPIYLHPSKFKPVWSWSRLPDDPIGGINAVVSTSGLVYVTKDVYFGPAILYALHENDGSEAWKFDFGTMPALNPPSYFENRVYVATTGHGDTYLWSFDGVTGAFKFKSQFQAQWPHVLAPTIVAGEVLTNGGYYGGQVYGFAPGDGAALWESAPAGDDDMSTPAVDATNIYFHDGNALHVWDRSSKAPVTIINDPAAVSFGYSYHGAPVVGGHGNVLAYAGGAFSGRASANVEQYDERPLTSFNIGARSIEWTSARAYLTTPAVANGVVYVAGNSPAVLHALDEMTGKVLWSWSGKATDAEFHRGAVVTRNLLFVSTDRAVYAIDLKTHQPVWEYPEPGMISISSSRILYIAVGARESTGKLVAISLTDRTFP